MKPKNIFLIRHGQSEGNVNKAIYAKKPDYALSLTEVGEAQARVAGEDLLRMGGNWGNFAVYYSPFFRTIETFNNISLAKNKIYDVGFNRRWVREEPRIREQEWHGKLPIDGYSQEKENERDNYGHFYYRFDGGESCADVYDRVSDFMDTLHRDFQKDDYPENCLIVTHGMTMRLIIMRWFHNTVEEFETWGNPDNCQIVRLQRNHEDKYDIVGGNPFKIHKVRHDYQCQLNVPFQP
jgi:broad specificity phosphatase PhoE